LLLDSQKARARLGWSSLRSPEEALAEAIAWYRAFREKGTVSSLAQLEAYVHDAKQKDAPWTR
jgi:hypothetical protein